jgi:hypothetical protein
LWKEGEGMIKNDNFVEVDCQQCGKNKVRIRKDGIYFGILCKECRNPKAYIGVKL